MAAQTERKKASEMHDTCPLLGFKCMVAPVSETACEGDPSIPHTPLSRDVQELLGRINASSQVAPSLCMVIRQGLQTKQVSDEAANTFLGDLKSLTRYDRSFKLFWAFCNIKGLNAVQATLSEIAGMTLEFDRIMPTQSRFAYASLLLIPGLEQLTFNPLLRHNKKMFIFPIQVCISF